VTSGFRPKLIRKTYNISHGPIYTTNNKLISLKKKQLSIYIFPHYIILSEYELQI